MVTAILSGLGLGFYENGLSALFKPITTELGFNRAVTSFAAGIGRLEGNLIAPLTGWLVDKFGSRYVIFSGILIISLGLALMNRVNSLWSYYLVWGVIISLGINSALTIAIDKTLTDWFVSQRGLAMGIRFAIIGLGAVVVIPLVTWLASTQGWRTTCLIWAAVMLAGAPVAWFFVRQKRPEYYGLLPDGAQIKSDAKSGATTVVDKGVEYASALGETEFTLREALRTPAYWILTMAFTLHMTIHGGFSVHCIPFLTDMGIQPTLAGGLMGMMMFFTIPSRFVAGILADRMRKGRLQLLLGGAFLLQAIGIAVFLVNHSIAAVYVFFILYGLGSGAPTLLNIIIRGRYFGRKAFGSNFGTSLLLVAPISLLAPVYTGWIYDTTGSYTTAFILFTILGTIAAALMCLVRPPKPPTRVTDIHSLV